MPGTVLNVGNIKMIHILFLPCEVFTEEHERWVNTMNVHLPNIHHLKTSQGRHDGNNFNLRKKFRSYFQLSSHLILLCPVAVFNFTYSFNIL